MRKRSLAVGLSLELEWLRRAVNNPSSLESGAYLGVLDPVRMTGWVEKKQQKLSYNHCYSVT